METAIYCRVSTEEQAQEGFSIRAQEQKLKEYANVKDWSIFNFYIDEGISGKNITERPAINRMIDDIKAGHVKNVLVFKLDRLTRSVGDLVYLIDVFNEHACAFNSLMESLDTSTASGRMFIKIIGIFAEFERENIAERVRVGKERKSREGYTNNTIYKSYGYDNSFFGGKGRENMRNLKDKKIALYKKEIKKDSAGFSTTYYRAIHAGRLWAYVRQLSAGEYWASQALQQKEEMFFTINWRNDINAAEYFIEYKGVFYDITRIDTFEGYKEDLKLYAIILASQPGAGTIIPWGESK